MHTQAFHVKYKSGKKGIFMNHKKIAPLLIIAAGCLWGTMGLFVRHLGAMGLGSMEIVELRSILAVVMLFPLTALRDRKLLRVKIRNLLPLACSGIFSIIFFNYCYFSTIRLMNLSAAAILLYTSPIFVMLLSIPLFHEKLTGQKVLALFMAFGGCCLVSGVASASQSLTAQGILLGLGSGLGYALYSIFSRISLNQGLGSVTITDYTFLFAVFAGAFLTDFSQYAGAYQDFGASLLVLAVVYTIVTTVLPYLLYTAGLAHVENGAASIMASVEPVVATILGFLFFSETPTLSALLGIVLVLAALILLSVKIPKKRT